MTHIIYVSTVPQMAISIHIAPANFKLFCVHFSIFIQSYATFVMRAGYSEIKKSELITFALQQNRNMIQSMTGYGKEVVQLPSKTITIEIKSLNSKGLDLNTRVPSAYREKELEIRDLLAKNL